MDPLERAPSNQSVPLVDYDVAAADQALLGAVDAFGGDHASEIRTSLTPVGQLAGSTETREHWHLANDNEPVLRTHDRFGHRVDEVEFHPSWHWLMTQGVGFETVADVSTPDLRHGDPAVADAFCASRLAGDWAGTFGTLPRGLDLAGIVARTTPHIN